jgi:hypothetical protein
MAAIWQVAVILFFQGVGCGENSQGGSSTFAMQQHFTHTFSVHSASRRKATTTTKEHKGRGSPTATLSAEHHESPGNAASGAVLLNVNH